MIRATLVPSMLLLALGLGAQAIRASEPDPATALAANGEGDHHWLSPAQLGERIGCSDDDLKAVVLWLLQQGLTWTPRPWWTTSCRRLPHGKMGPCAGWPWITEPRT
jgi:hypothetical protein